MEKDRNAQQRPQEKNQPKPLDEQPGRTAQSINPGQGTSMPRPDQAKRDDERERGR
jgi:hypothetical protein